MCSTLFFKSGFFGLLYIKSIFIHVFQGCSVVVAENGSQRLAELVVDQRFVEPKVGCRTS